MTTSPPDVTPDDIRAAAALLEGVANRTPVLSSRTLDRQIGGRLFVKCESFQRTGSFKFRGAYNALSRLCSNSRPAGVLTYSSGNHAQALSLAGRLLDVPVTVIMPADAPCAKIEATRSYGAEIIHYSRTEITREELASEVSLERDLPVIPPYDHPNVVAGQGTVGLELFDDHPELDTLLVCCGGVGLLSGCAIAAKAHDSAVRVVGVEPAAADDATRSFYSGELVTVRDPETIADGARTPSLGCVTFPLVRRFVDDMVTVTEDEIVDGMRFLWERMKLVVEPTGALAVAAALAGKVNLKGRRAGAVVSGGNVDLIRALSLFGMSRSHGTSP